MKTLQEWLKKADEETLDVLRRYNLVKLEGESYKPVFSPLEFLRKEDYNILERKLKGIIFKDDGDSVMYLPWEEKGEGIIFITRRLGP